MRNVNLPKQISFLVAMLKISKAKICGNSCMGRSRKGRRKFRKAQKSISDYIVTDNKQY